MSLKAVARRRRPKPSGIDDVLELGRLVERFHALYRDQRHKRCVYASAELFVYLADRGFDVVAIRRNVKAGKSLYEHSWVEVDIWKRPYVIDVTGGQQFRGLGGPIFPKAEYLSRLVKAIIDYPGVRRRRKK